MRVSATSRASAGARPSFSRHRVVNAVSFSWWIRVSGIRLLRLRLHALHRRFLGGEGLTGVAGVVGAREVPEILVIFLERGDMDRILHALLERIVENLHDLRIHALRPGDAVRRVRDDAEPE